MGTTTNYAWPYPELGDAPNGPAAVQALADAVDTDVKAVEDALGLEPVTSGAKPATPYQGQLIYETDNAVPRFWNGTTWIDLTRRFKRCTTTLAKQNDTVLADVAGLSFNVEAGRYLIECQIFYDASPNGDLKFHLTGTATVSDQDLRILRPRNVAASVDDILMDSVDISLFPIQSGGIGTADKIALHISGQINFSAAGTWKAQAAQWASDLGITEVHAGSYMLMQKVA